MADLYAEDGVLLPTLSDDVRTNREEIKEYFTEDFLPKKPSGTITESHVRIIDEDSAHSGNYTFTVTDKDGSADQGACSVHVRVREDRRQVADRRTPLVGGARLILPRPAGTGVEQRGSRAPPTVRPAPPRPARACRQNRRR